MNYMAVSSSVKNRRYKICFKLPGFLGNWFVPNELTPESLSCDNPHGDV